MEQGTLAPASRQTCRPIIGAVDLPAKSMKSCHTVTTVPQLLN